jgi:hypothetical protein
MGFSVSDSRSDSTLGLQIMASGLYLQSYFWTSTAGRASTVSNLRGVNSNRV